MSENSTFWAVIIAAIPTSATIGAALARLAAANRRTDAEHREHGESAQISARAVLDAATKESIAGMLADLREARSETVAVREENSRVRKDRDRGWDLARGWRAIARDQWWEINRLHERLGAPPDPPLLGLEEIEGKPPPQ